jgi:PAS domain S-box-containing protein
MYAVRIAAYGYCFAVCSLLAYERGYGPGTYVLLAILFLGLPHVLYLRARNAADPRRAELQHLPFDALLIGAWVGEFGYAVWALFGGLLGTTLTNVVNTGLRGFVYSVVAFAIGAGAWGWINGFAFEPWTSTLVAVLCLLGVFIYTSLLGVVVYLSSQRLAATRQKLRENELRFRLITENAGDLIALFDAEGNTLYASPSHARFMGEESLQQGSDALAHVHPEDQATFRDALVAEAQQGSAREWRYRIIDADGRTLYFEASAHTFVHEGKTRIVLVSTDVTLLREHDEQRRLSAQVMHNLSEAVMIWDVAGTVLSVNEALCELTGYQSAELIGQPESQFRNALQPAQFYEDMAAQLAKTGRWSGSTWTRRKNGSLYREMRIVNAIRDDSSQVTHYVAIFFETS